MYKKEFVNWLILQADFHLDCNEGNVYWHNENDAEDTYSYNLDDVYNWWSINIKY